MTRRPPEKQCHKQMISSPLETFFFAGSDSLMARKWRPSCLPCSASVAYCLPKVAEDNGRADPFHVTGTGTALGAQETAASIQMVSLICIRLVFLSPANKIARLEVRGAKLTSLWEEQGVSGRMQSRTASGL